MEVYDLEVLGFIQRSTRRLSLLFVRFEFIPNPEG